MLDQLSVFDTPVIVDSTPISLMSISDSTEPGPGDLVVPRAREGYSTPLFPGQVCEVLRVGLSLGRKSAFCAPVKWKERGVPTFPCNPLDLVLLSKAKI